MSEDSKFIMNVEHCVSEEKDSRKHDNIVYFSCTSFGDEKKKTPKFTSNAALSFFILFVIIYTS